MSRNNSLNYMTKLFITRHRFIFYCYVINNIRAFKDSNFI